MNLDLTKNFIDNLVVENGIESYITNVPLKVHKGDGMFKEGNEKYYFKCGFEIIKYLDKLSRDGVLPKNNVNNILDMACGFGRVTRWLSVFYPDSKLYVSELMDEAVKFNTATFSTIPIPAFTDATKFKLNQKLDLIWIGSLFTHLSETKIKTYIKEFSTNLESGGLIVCSLHGEYVARRIRSKEKIYNLSNEAAEKVIDEYDIKGFGYQNYSHSKTYGISVQGYPWLYNIIDKYDNLSLVNYIPQGWMKHQDLAIIQCK